MHNETKSTTGMKMTSLQYATIFICYLMNILDGMDVLVIAYCAPAIAKAWEVGPETLGIVFSSGLAGMTIGALFLTPLADKFGRKTMILWSAIIMGISMYLTALCQDVTQLMILRLISGLGIGTMLACTTALVDEYTEGKSKNFWVNFSLSGYPTGAVITGLLAQYVIPNYGWQMMFKIAGVASIITIPLVWFFLSESLQFYFIQQPKNALSKANAILIQLGRELKNALPTKPEKQAALPVGKLLDGEFRTPTLKLWLALFLSFGALYFLTSWIPKLATDAGLSQSLAIWAGTAFNGGAFFGICTQGFFSTKFGLKKTIGTFLILTALLMILFRFFIGSDVLLFVFALLGFGIQGGFVGLYAVAAKLYPTEFKSTGIGWGIGLGRFGGIAGPALGGLLIGMGMGMASSFAVFAIPTLLGGIVTLLLASSRID